MGGNEIHKSFNQVIHWKVLEGKEKEQRQEQWDGNQGHQRTAGRFKTEVGGR